MGFMRHRLPTWAVDAASLVTGSTLLLSVELLSPLDQTVLTLVIHPDHVHLFVRVFPTTSAAEVVKECKGVTAHELGKKYPQLLKLPSLWTRAYFASTAANVS
jgi:REP element-mobilizing transposase RayT